MSTLAQHTPGPWHIGVKEAHYCVYDAHGWWIADASPTGKSEEGKANAHLIANAPELLQALEATLCYFEADGDDEQDRADYAIAIANTIKKARGQ